MKAEMRKGEIGFIEWVGLRVLDAQHDSWNCPFLDLLHGRPGRECPRAYSESGAVGLVRWLEGAMSARDWRFWRGKC